MKPGAEPVQVRHTYPTKPDLRVRIACAHAPGSGKLVRVDLECAAVDIDRYEQPILVRGRPWGNHSVEELIAQPGDLGSCVWHLVHED